MAHILGQIAVENVWHVYTAKAAKHGQGIFDARPVCGRKALPVTGNVSAQVGQGQDDKFLAGVVANLENGGQYICNKCRQHLIRVVTNV